MPRGSEVQISHKTSKKYLKNIQKSTFLGCQNSRGGAMPPWPPDKNTPGISLKRPGLAIGRRSVDRTVHSLPINLLGLLCMVSQRENNSLAQSQAGLYIKAESTRIGLFHPFTHSYKYHIASPVPGNAVGMETNTIGMATYPDTRDPGAFLSYPIAASYRAMGSG